MSRVFIVQRPVVRNRTTGILEDKFDVGPAGVYGHLITLLSSRAQPFNPPPIILELRAKLRTYCDADWILCLGSPILIGWAAAIASDVNNGRVNFLQWHGVDGEYRAVRSDLFGRTDGDGAPPKMTLRLPAEREHP